MIDIENFMVVHYGSPRKALIIFTKNCTKRRAKHIWKKYLKKNSCFKGTYAVAYANDIALVKEISEFV